MKQALSRPPVLVAVVGIIAVALVLIVAMLQDKNGMLLAGGLGILGAAIAGPAGYAVGNRPPKKNSNTSTVDETKPAP